jgi:hypothetical protein
MSHTKSFIGICIVSGMKGSLWSASLTWYKGESGVFDFHIIPLARKLKECGVFGVPAAVSISLMPRRIGTNGWLEGKKL